MEQRRRIIKNSRRYIFLAAGIAALLNIFVVVKNTNATLNFDGWSANHIRNQAFAQGVYRCYSAKNGVKGGPVYDNANSEDAKPEATQIAQIIHEDTDTHTFGYKDLFTMATASDAMWLPNGLAPVVGINCAFLINDFKTSVDVSEQFNVPYSDTVYERLGVPRSKLDEVRKGGNKKDVDAFMTGMGYEISDEKVEPGTTTCYAIDYRADVLGYDESLSREDGIKLAWAGKWNTQIDTDKDKRAQGASKTQVCVTVGEDSTITSAESTGWVKEPYYMHGGEYFLMYVDKGYTTVHFQIWAVTDPGDHDNCTDLAGTCMTGIFQDDSYREDTDGAFDAKGMTLPQFEEKLRSTVTQIRYTQGIGASGSDKKYNTLAIAPRCNQWVDQSPASCNDPTLWTYKAIGIYVYDIVKYSSDAANFRTWKLTGDGNTALKYISDNSSTLDDSRKKAGSSWSSAYVTKNEKPLLYQWYMANQSIGRVNLNCNPTEEELKLHPDWVYTVEWFNSKEEKLTNCYVVAYDSTAKVVLLDNKGYFNTYLSPITDLFNEMHYTSSILVDVDPNDIITVEQLQKEYAASLLPTGKESNNCYSGAGSLSWIVCPLIENGSKLIIDKYVDWVEPALQVNTLLFGKNDKSPAYAAWNVFRNIANLAFVILFIFIIFSQTTGVGIDNYGIKKILPKLIIGAILINGSYIICQLAIDVANIVGYGIAGVFQWVTNQINTSMPSTIKVEGVVVDPTKEASLDGVLTDGVAGIGAVVVLIIGVISLASVLSQGTAIIIPILMAVLGVAISFFTLIAILGIRQAAAVLLVVASPLAFVCYMLPNTKKFFEKWAKAFMGLLVAFPACSALIYGGDLVGRILVSTSYGSTWILITAAIVSIAPVFFIPKLIRSSMGAISNAITNASRGISNTARNAGYNSHLAKEMRANSDWNRQRRLNLRHAGVRKDSNGKIRKRFLGSGLYGIGFGRREKIARARNAVLADYEEENLGNRMTNEGGVDFLHSQMAAVDSKLNDAGVSAVEARISQGQMTMTVMGDDGSAKEVTLDPSDINQLKEALVQAIIKGEDEKQKAITNILSQKGDKGREAVHGAIEDTEKAAQHMSDAEISKLMSTHRSLASHIMNNFAGAYKENNRSTFDWAARTQNESEKFNRSDLAGKKKIMKENGLTGKSMSVSAVKPSTLLDMDDKEFERLASVKYDPKSKEDVKKAIGLSNAIIKALSSEAAVGGKIERINQLKDLADKLGQVQGPKP